jgi:hypothetical protein
MRMCKSDKPDETCPCYFVRVRTSNPTVDHLSDRNFGVETDATRRAFWLAMAILDPYAVAS